MRTLKSNSHKKSKNGKSKKGCSFGVVALVFLIIVIAATSSCEPSFTKDEAISYDEQIDNYLVSTKNHFSDVVKAISKSGSASEVYSDIERHKNVISANCNNLDDLKQTNYKDSANTYISNALAACNYAQEAINENDLESVERYKQTKILVETDLKDEVISARKAFLKECELNENEINKIMNAKKTFN